MTSSTLASHTGLTKQPKALYFLFFAELWERFSFYGMRALLVLFMTRELNFLDARAYGIFGAYGALVYGSNVVGGYLADNFLGNRRAILIGSLIIAAGHMTLAMPFDGSLYYGLAFLIVGTGFFKANVSSFLGQFYKKDDPRRDGGFTIFYMGINIGGLLAPLVCGTIGEVYGWHYGFGIAGIGMLLGAAVFLKGEKYYENKGLPPAPEALDRPLISILSINHIIILGALLVIPLAALTIQNYEILGNFLSLAGFSAFLYISYLAFKSTPDERKCIFTLLMMYVFVASFFAIFEQLGGSLNLFTERNIDRVFTLPDWIVALVRLFSNDPTNVSSVFIMPTTWSQMMNPFFIILLSPFVSQLWIWLGRRGLEPQTPIKMCAGILVTALGFYIFIIGIRNPDTHGMVSIAWLIFGFFFFTLGELFVSPVSLSMVTKLAPARFVSLMMGAYFFATAFAHQMAAKIAQIFAAPEGVQASSDKFASLAAFENTFIFVTKFAVVVGCVMVVTYPFVRKTFKRHG